MALGTGLVNYYKFDGSLQDDFDAYHGVNNGTYDTTGLIRNARGFNGSDQNIGFSSFVFPLGAKTISFWFQTDLAGTSQFVFDNGGSDSTKHGWALDLTTGPVVRWFSSKGTGGENRFAISATTSIVNATWYFVTATWDGTTDADKVILYVNAVAEVTGQALLAETADPTNDLKIGSTSGGITFLGGIIDEFGVWDTVKTPAEITTLYNGGAGLPRYLWNHSGTIPVGDVAGKGQAEIMTRYPVTSGLTAGTQKQEGRQSNLVAERGSVVPDRFKRGL